VNSCGSLKLCGIVAMAECIPAEQRDSCFSA
jgi:hypothetical protein